MIEATDLVKSFGSVRALRSVSFSVADGEIVAGSGENATP